MAVQSGSKRKKNIKELILDKLDVLGFKLFEEADFYLGLIAERAEKNVNDKIYRATGQRRRFRSAKSDKPEIKNIETELDTAITSFSQAIVANSTGRIISSTNLYLSMKGICPLWPFC